MIDQTIIDEIRERVDIVDVISNFISLKKAGSNYKAICPFHVEKTASFMVNSSKQIYHCFGCGVGGNVYNFLMKIEGISFIEAVKVLAEKAGISLPEISKKGLSEKGAIYEINEQAATFYHETLLSQIGGRALRYLKGRGLNDQTIERFRLGYAPPSWNSVKDMLLKKGYSIENILKAGLIVPKEKTNIQYYDRFRDRIIFPIFSPQGKVLGFGGRVLDDSLPKYINSPETPVYIKGQNLYGLNLTKVSMREKGYVLVVEGYLDVIICSQYGFEPVVAPLGTALTRDQVKLIKRYVDQVILIFDQDSAGVNATLRGFDLLLEQGIDIKVVTLPEKDPADFLIKHDGSSFRNLIQKAEDFLTFQLKFYISSFDITTTEGKVKVVKELLPIISKISSPIRQHDFIKKVAERIDVDERWIIRDVSKGRPVITSRHIIQKEKGGLKLERMLIKFILEDEEARDRFIHQIRKEEFEDRFCKHVISLIKDLVSKGEIINSAHIMDLLDEEDQRILSSLLIESYAIEDKFKLVKDLLNKIKIRDIDKKISYLQKEISKNKDVDPTLLREYEGLVREKTDLSL
ncbi:MAG: DNA primase [bacterium]|nr:DNA primase [bacterium]